MGATRQVEIFGQSYLIRAEEDDERNIEELAAYVDATMRSIATTSQTVDTLKISILTALHLAHELFEARRDVQGVRDEVNRRVGRLSDALAKALE